MVGKKYSPFEDYFHKYKINITNLEKEQLGLFLYNNHVNKGQQTTTYKQINVLSLPLLKNIRDQILLILNKHNLLLCTNWAQLYRKEDLHALHTHTGSVYSGVLYVEGKGEDGTVFHHPISKIVECCGHVFKHKVMEKFESGVLILFPSYIPHEVLKQEEENNRIIISFNTQLGKDL